MARKNRTDKNVMESLAVIAESAIQQTGFFFMDSNETNFQTGIIRTNCVDCLDRTNTAQFALGRCALAYQLHKMGFLKSPPKLEFDSDCVTMLESLYEIHGDTLALQYGGSQLVHRIKTYRKTAAWTSTGSDFMQNLSRYYSNTFSDQEKQQSINLFLGHFVPYEQRDDSENLWDITNDYQLHNPLESSGSLEKNITMWFSDIIRKNLPNSTSIANKIVKELIRIHTLELEMVDLYSNYHLTYQLTSLEENIAYQISQFARNFMPTFRTNFSPFEPGKRNASTTMSPSSIASTNGSNSSSDESDSSSDEDDTTLSLSMKSSMIEQRQPTKASKVEDSLPATCQELYGFELHAPDKDAMSKYKSYVNIQKRSQPHEKTDKKPKAFVLESLATYNDSFEKVTEPKVKDETIQKYQNYCNLIINKNYEEKNTSLALIEKYVNFTQ
jgi:phosphatidylinositol 3,5-bisphosphate 5-phosphatase